MLIPPVSNAAGSMLGGIITMGPKKIILVWDLSLRFFHWALAALAMFILVPSLLATGLGGSRDPWEDLHGGLAYGLLAVIGVHLAGLVWHAVRHHENVALSMIPGRKEGRPEDGLASAHPGWALGCAIAATAWIGGLFANHDPAAARVRLPFTGTSIQLGESDGGVKARVKERRKHRDDHN